MSAFDIESFISMLEYVIPAVLSLIGIIVTFIRTGKVSKNINKEVSDLKYRLTSYREETPAPATTFVTEVSQYRKNAAGELEELPIKKDLQQQLNSYRDVELATAIEKFMPVDVDLKSDPVEAYHFNADRLDVLLWAQDAKEELIEKYGYSPDVTIDQIVSDLQVRQKAIKDTASKAVVKEEVKNEGKENEQKS